MPCDHCGGTGEVYTHATAHPTYWLWLLVGVCWVWLPCRLCGGTGELREAEKEAYHVSNHK